LLNCYASRHTRVPVWLQQFAKKRCRFSVTTKNNTIKSTTNLLFQERDQGRPVAQRSPYQLRHTKTKLIADSTRQDMILLRLLVLCSFLILTRARVKKPGRVDVDQLRHEFLEQEQRLWNFVADQTDNRVKETDLAEVSLIREFEQFGDRLHEVRRRRFLPEKCLKCRF
jgi:hypothetical protein